MNQNVTKKKLPKGCMIALIIIIIISIVVIIVSIFAPSDKGIQQRTEREQKVNIDSLVLVIKKDTMFEIKDNLKDPDGYEVIKSYATGLNDSNKVSITTEFRSKNSFGGYVIGLATCDVDITTNEVSNLNIENE